VITLLKSYELSLVSLIINKMRGDLLMSGESLSPLEIADLLKTPLLGVLPEEYSIYGGAFSDLHPSFKLIANNLLTGKKKLYDVTKKYSGLLGTLRRTLKRSL
jgi:septum formation inhibitor-activating ATPase MinD